MRRGILIFGLLLPTILVGAISVAIVWEVREAGNDTNGGGFKAAATGTDMSIFDNKNLGGCTNCQSTTVNISTTDAATTTTTTLTSATANFSSAIVGNVIYLTLGGGSCNSGTVSAQWREVTAYTDVSTITLDATPAGSGDTCTGVTMNIGGALKTLAGLNSAMVASNKAFVTNLTTPVTAAVSFAQATVFPSDSTSATVLQGYTTTRGDGGLATVTYGTNTGISLTFSNYGWWVENLAINCSSLGTSTGIVLAGFDSHATGNKVANCTSAGISSPGTSNTVLNNEVTGCSGSAAIVVGPTSTVALNNIHDNTTVGVLTAATTGVWVVGNLILNNTGTNSYGVTFKRQGTVMYNTISGNGGHGIYNSEEYDFGSVFLNNVVANNGAAGTVYGIKANSTGAIPAQSLFDGNCFYNNRTAARNNMDSITGIFGVGPHTNVFDKLVTAGDIFTNAAGGDWSLNATANQGALCRSAAVPATWPGLATTTHYGDMGAVRHADPAVGGGTKAFPWVQ